MRALLRRLTKIEPAEMRATLWSCAYFFCILCAYYIIRPIRDEAGVAGGIRNLPWLFTGTMVAMLLVNPPFAALVARLPRTRFIPIAYRFFILNLVIFWALFTWLPADSRVWIGRAFYIWTSVFNLFVVSVFWGFMADAFDSAQGKRLFGFIGVGGTLGGIVGSAITASLVTQVGSAGLLLVSAVLLELSVFVVGRLSAIFTTLRATAAERGVAPSHDSNAVIGGGIWDGITHVARSPYLLGISAYMLLYTIGSTFLYFQQAAIVDASRTTPEAQTQLFAQIDLSVNVLTVLVQAFLTARIMMWLGVAGALAIVPAISVMGFLGLGFAPSITMLVAFLVLRRAGNFAVARPSREVLYTVVSREDKFKAKSFIDTFVYRFGDQVGAWANPLLAAFGLGMAGVALVAAPLAGLWLMVGFWLGKRQASLAHAADDGGEQPRPGVVAA
ncbi:MAG: MFS transporter [Gemmatimonadaceae bacterium]